MTQQRAYELIETLFGYGRDLDALQTSCRAMVMSVISTKPRAPGRTSGRAPTSPRATSHRAAS